MNSCVNCLEWEIVVFLPWILLLLSRKLFKSTDDAESGVARFDNVVDISVACSIVWIAEQVVVLLCLNILENLDCSLSSHHCNVGRWPCIVDVSAQLLAAHGDVSSSIRFAKGYCHLWYSGFPRSLKKFCPVGDDAAVFLLGSA